MKRLIAPLLLAATLAGCAQPFAPVATLEDRVTAIATLDVREAARHVLTTTGLEPWVEADIDHVELALYKGTESRPVATLTVGRDELAQNKTVKFTQLRMNSRYTISARAWSDAAETSPIDNADHDAASCTTPFDTTTVETVTVDAVKLKLRNKVFSGNSNAVGITVTNGIIENTTATETISVDAPDSPSTDTL